ncbi:MAG: Gfo/Idh/MocA family oxidoreductase [Pelagibacteraceae bacterium]|nr:Gfo/Idh/MocA family oxidoreductase [Pelagibacteraceae bacterium]MBT5213186.1 Gfo/Idh/MocA family oxidoreductase [Pelagibacteraceae bacterium]
MKLKGAIIGCGFFSHNHMYAWKEIKNVEIVAACDLDKKKVSDFSKKFQLANHYTNIDDLLNEENLDFVDVVTTMETHLSIAKILSKRKVPTSMQKPFAENLVNAKKIVRLYQNTNTPLMVHENFRWQTPLIKVKKLEKKYNLKNPHYAKISFRHANPVGYTNQTYLYDLEEYLILDVGIHLYDLSRFFLGEADSVYTVNQNTNKKFRGETAFTSLIRHQNTSVSIIDASISSIKTPDRFAQTLINIEYTNGSIDLDYDYKITVHKKGIKKSHSANPKKLKWTSKPWDQIQESIANTHNHFISCLRTKKIHDTSGVDNIKSLSLVFASYQSNRQRKEVKLNEK